MWLNFPPCNLFPLVLYELQIFCVVIFIKLVFVISFYILSFLSNYLFCLHFYFFGCFILSLIYFVFYVVFYIRFMFVAQLRSRANNLVSKCRRFIFVDQYKTKFCHILSHLLFWTLYSLISMVVSVGNEGSWQKIMV